MRKTKMNRRFCIAVTKIKQRLFSGNKKRTNGFLSPNQWFFPRHCEIIHRSIFVIHNFAFIVHKVFQVIHRKKSFSAEQFVATMRPIVEFVEQAQKEEIKRGLASQPTMTR